MRESRTIATVLSILLAGIAGRLPAQTEAQSGSGKPLVEILLRQPLPADSEPKITVLSLPISPGLVAGAHTHAGPVFAYILQGEIENHVEPDPPKFYKPGEFFYEAPMHVHKLLRNLSQTEPANLIVFQAGNTGRAAPAIKTLLQEPLLSTANQELTLYRVTLPPEGLTETQAQSNPGALYVLEGNLETPGST